MKTVDTMSRKLEAVLGDDPVLESELWSEELRQIASCYDGLEIGLNDTVKKP